MTNTDGSALGLLMARGGSKRIPRKNVKRFAGRPILAWPLKAMLESGLFAKVVVSSDDPEIIRIAVEGGAEAPFVRPPELADDHATTMEVIRHAVNFLAERGERHDFVCCAYGTSVFLTPEILLRAKALLDDAEAVMAATPFEHPVQRGFTIAPGGAAEFPERKFMNARTQDLTPYYHDVGLFYWLRTEALARLERAGAHIMDLHVKPLVLPRGAVQDIDEAADWEAAEKLFLPPANFESIGKEPDGVQ